MTTNIGHAAKHFQFEGEFVGANPHGCGHINDTYAVWFRRGEGGLHRYLVQRINHYVFKEPEKLMRNIELVTRHLRHKIVATGGDPARETLNLVATVDGHTFYKAPDGSYWRAYLFIEGARTYEMVESLDHISSAAKAFGNFQKQLADLPAEQLHETIPDFHHTHSRFLAFVAAVEGDTRNRVRSAQAEIEFVERRSAECSVLVDLLAQGNLPQRVTHNDTKFNNVMIDDQTGEGVCVVDLDTVMPGLALYDFGDAVRSAANTAAEDETDLTKVSFSLEIFERYAHGYLDAARDFLSPLEVEHLPFSARLMTLECGIRFLTDYLNGDLYFKIHRENHNLDRCRTQFKMVGDMESQFDRMVEIVSRYR